MDDHTVGTMIGGVASAALGRILLFPLDTAKAKIQVVPGVTDSLRNVLSTTYKREGLKGLYSGFGIAFWGALPAQCLYFTTFETIKARLQKDSEMRHSNAFVDLTAGFIAEVVSCVLWVPIDVSKERLQTQSTLKVRNYNGSLDAIRQIARDEGFLKLYRGYGATLLSFGPYSALFFMFYEKCREQAVKLSPGGQIGPLPALGCGIVSGALAAFLTTPLDLVKLRLQVQKRSGEKTTQFGYGGFFTGLKDLFVREGMKGAFSGGLARVAFGAPSMAIGGAVTEIVRQWYVDSRK